MTPRDLAILKAGRQALRRSGNVYRQAPCDTSGQRFGRGEVFALIEAGALRFGNKCHSCIVLTDEGREALWRAWGNA